MEELLKAINIAVLEGQKLNTALQNAVAYANNITNEATAKLKAAADKEAENASKDADLAAREAEVKKIEDIVALKTQAAELIKKAKQAEVIIEQKEIAFKTACKEQLAIIAREKQKNAGEAEMIKKDFEELKKEKEKLVKDKQDMVQRIIENLSKDK